MADHYKQAGYRRAHTGRNAGPGTVGQPRTGCAFAAAALLITAVVSLIASTNENPAPSYLKPTMEIRDPGYSSSLCEGRDYQVYDDCAY
ncbi:hypothetical protein ACFY40_33790 [Streptomyces sp. NPDC012950]|uniref:hypothetical protein n=1 Tax=Streptomyces sp. NPDC012950 TaxID=3364858 RepID=UPI00367CF2F5